MPSRQPPRLQPGQKAREHLAGAQANYHCYERFLQTPEHTAWALVALFYAALHLVRAAAITKCASLQEPVSDNHNERIKYVMQHIGRVAFDYRDLENASKVIRYNLWRPTPEEVARYHDQEFARLGAYLAAQNIAWSEQTLGEEP